MRLANYPSINDELWDALTDYGRANNSSPIIIIECLIEKFLYEKQYLDVPVEESKTPEDIYNEQKNKFTRKKDGKKYKLYFEDEYYFGRFKENQLDPVIDGLLTFSEEEIKELSFTMLQGSPIVYKRFLFDKLKNQELPVTDYTTKPQVTESITKDGQVWFKLSSRVPYKEIKQVIFSAGYSKEQIDMVRNYLNNVTINELLTLISNAEQSKSFFNRFVLEYVTSLNSGVKRRYCRMTKYGTFVIQKAGLTFGEHHENKVDDVLNFLEKHDWDKKYSSKHAQQPRGKYRGWLYNEMEKEKLES